MAASDRPKQLVPLRRRQLLPPSDRQPVQRDVHDAHARERDHPIAERLTHAADLAVASFDQDDAESIGRLPPNCAGQGRTSQYEHARRHAIQEFSVEWAVHTHHVLALVAVLGPQDLVDDVAVVREQDESGGVLVQSSNGEDACGVLDRGDDVAFDVRFARRRDPDRLVVLEIDPPRSPWDRTAVQLDPVAGSHRITQDRPAAVQRDAPLLHQPVRLSPRADPLFRKKFIDADAARLRAAGRCGGHERSPRREFRRHHQL